MLKNPIFTNITQVFLRECINYLILLLLFLKDVYALYDDQNL
jgi:hypothetical protein